MFAHAGFSSLGPSEQLIGGLGEDFPRYLIAVECSGGTRVRLDMDEELDDLLFGHSVVQRDPQLSAQWFMRAEDRRDRYGNQCPAASVQTGSSPRVSKCMSGCEAHEVLADLGLPGAQWQKKWEAEKSLSRSKCVLIFDWFRHHLLLASAVDFKPRP